MVVITVKTHYEDNFFNLLNLERLAAKKEPVVQAEAAAPAHVEEVAAEAAPVEEAAPAAEEVAAAETPAQ